MSEQESDAFIHEVFESGAFLVIKRPLTIDAVRHIRQDVIRQRMHTHEKCENKNVIIMSATKDTEKQDNGSTGYRKKGKYELRKRVYPSSDEDDDDDDDYSDDSGMKRKICVEWTEELHQKFLIAVRQLGEGSCFPKKILDLMGVPGLTRMQVASHLQKCRKEKLINQKKTTQIHALPGNLSTQALPERKFGSMPNLPIDHEESNTLIGINLSINGWQTEVNHTRNQTYKGSSILQKNITQRIEYTQIPFGSELEINQDDKFGSRITKATNNILQQTITTTLHDAGQGANDQNLLSFRRQASEEFPEFLKDMDGNGPNDI
ncbi:putative transcription factor MYB-HB-like family [Helianthus anomalus]